MSMNCPVALLSIVWINFCLSFACRQTLHIPSKSSNPSISDRIAAECRFASGLCQSLFVIVEAEIGSNVDDVFVFLVFRSAIVGSVGGAPDCTVIGVVVPKSEVRV